MVKRRFEGEQLLNHFVMECIGFTFIGMFVVAFLNWFKIFGTNTFITQLCFGLVFIITVVASIVGFLTLFKGKWLSYFLISCVVLMTYIICASMTYHAVIISVFPLVYSSVFQDKKISIFTIIASSVFTVATVYIGYNYGVADLNMVFLPIDRIVDTVEQSGQVFGSDFIIDGLWWKLFAYVCIPRLLIMGAFSCVCIGISHIIKLSYRKAEIMENKANHDGMTGLYNKAHFTETLSYYRTCDTIGIMYLDANNLKIINDTKGHAAGDSLLVSISTAIHSLETDGIKGYRIGGDEFVVIITNRDEAMVKIICDQFKYNLDYISRTNRQPLQASLGDAFGRGANFDELLLEAERKMYEEKEKFHSENSVME